MSIRTAGSRFKGLIRMTQAEHHDACRAFQAILPKPGVTVTFNGTVLAARTPLRTVEATLLTEIEDEQGILRRRPRKTTIDL